MTATPETKQAIDSNPDRLWVTRGHAGRVARSLQLEALLRRLIPLYGDDWREMARTAITDCYYPPNSSVNNVATTLRNVAKRLGCPCQTGAVTQQFRADCQRIGDTLALLPARHTGEPGAKALRATYDLLSALICEELIDDEDDADWAVFAVMGLLESKLSATAYRIA